LTKELLQRLSAPKQGAVSDLVSRSWTTDTELPFRSIGQLNTFRVGRRRDLHRVGRVAGLVE
jgi:hypothetical protein